MREKCVRKASLSNKTMRVLRQLGRKLLAQPTEGVCWHADHIVGVAQGGGECGVENMQVMCFACHQEKTAAEAGARAARRRRAE